jgi:photosystem II stability/assembly factor-like uncharacterized protein
MTWEPGIIEQSGNYMLMSMAALNKDTVWAAAVRSAGAKGDIFRSYDGGAHWEKPDTSIYKGNTSFPDAIHFFDKDTGICFGDPENGYFEIYRTVNGGDSWTRVPSGSIPPSVQGEGCYNDVLCALGDTVWVGTTMGKVYRTVDKGLNWTVSFPFETASVRTIAFRNSKHGLIFGSGTNNYRRTTDGGTTWETFAILSGSYGCSLGKSLIFVKGIEDIGGVFLCGGNTNNYHFASYSEDDGETWEFIDEMYHSSFGAYNVTTGWSCVSGSTVLVPDIYKFGELPTRVPNPTFGNDISIYPNPGDGRFSITGVRGFPEIEILDMVGRKVYSNKITSPGSEIRIDISQEPSGLYMIRFGNQNYTYSKKIVVRK